MTKVKNEFILWQIISDDKNKKMFGSVFLQMNF